MTSLGLIGTQNRLILGVTMVLLFVHFHKALGFTLCLMLETNLASCSVMSSCSVNPPNLSLYFLNLARSDGSFYLKTPNNVICFIVQQFKIPKIAF